ncbi:MAG: molybdate ABC transporter substrate-binding protein, partial [Fibrobacteres bacterium]|nr:molybdate ABC transporter substrate-binding protein [Fibrobacterota bacterium]
SVKDLGKPGVKLVLTHSVYSTMGWLYPKIAEKAGISKELMANKVSETKGGSEAANAVVMKAADAAIVWNAVAALRKENLDMIPITGEYLPVSGVDAISSATFGKIDLGHIKVTMTLLKNSPDKKAAEDFAAFVASPEGAKIWEKNSFGPAYPALPYVKNGKSELNGSVFVYCAAGMRSPVEVLAKSYEKDYGVKVEITYDGSNKLLGQIKLSKKGDVYIAGDAEYIDMAAKENLLGKSREDICYFEPVIMVRKGNPKGIATLADLLKAGIKIGQGDEKVAAVGRLTVELLDKNGVNKEGWRKNVVLSTPTVNELGSAVKLGTIDAAVVWRSIADDYPEEGDIISIPKDKNIMPVVEGASLTYSKNVKAAEAFLKYMVSERGRFVMMNDGYATDKP